MKNAIYAAVKDVKREDAAASIQQVLEDIMLESITRLLRHNPSKRLGVSGGVFANVRLNNVIAEKTDVDEIFVVPPMGDEGTSIGGVFCFLLERDGLEAWLRQRRRLDSVYFGPDYTAEADRVLGATPGIAGTGEAPVSGAAQRLNGGQIGGIYWGRMEFGPRALGARSILGESGEARNAR